MASPIPAGRRAYHRVTVENPTLTRTSDGDQIAAWTPAALPWYVAFDPSIGVDQERAKAGTVVTQPGTTVTGPWRADITTGSRLIDQAGNVLYVISAESPDRRQRELVLQCSSIGPVAGVVPPVPAASWVQETDWIQAGWYQTP